MTVCNIRRMCQQHGDVVYLHCRRHLMLRTLMLESLSSQRKMQLQLLYQSWLVNLLKALVDLAFPTSALDKMWYLSPLILQVELAQLSKLLHRMPEE